MTTISAQVVLASQNKHCGNTLWTFVLEYPRFIHAEFMTHRMFARNASSSRAIPVSRMIAAATMNPAIPLFWGKNRRGMQAVEEHDFPVRLGPKSMENVEAYRHAAMEAAKVAQAFDEAGYHKQIINRLLEPFLHIRVVMSATNLVNFMALRDHEDAEPHIRMLAQAMKKAMNETLPQSLMPGEWHMPFIRPRDVEVMIEKATTWGWDDDQMRDRLHRLSVARCASISYNTVDGFEMTDDRADTVWEKLSGTPMHASPFEHVAQADSHDPRRGWDHKDQHGCFVGFRQLRKMMPGECAHD